MLKRAPVKLLIVLASLVATTAGQNSNTSSWKSPAPSHPAKVKPKPLTPQSAMPATHKSSARSPVPDSSRKTSADLNRIEHENVKSAGPSRSKEVAPKVAPIRPVQTAKDGGSGINATYQKPKDSKK